MNIFLPWILNRKDIKPEILSAVLLIMKSKREANLEERRPKRGLIMPLLQRCPWPNPWNLWVYYICEHIIYQMGLHMWKSYPTLSRKTINVNTRGLKEGGKRVSGEKVAMWWWNLSLEWCSQEPSNADGSQNLRGKKQVFSQSLLKAMLTPWF